MPRTKKNETPPYQTYGPYPFKLATGEIVDAYIERNICIYEWNCEDLKTGTNDFYAGHGEFKRSLEEEKAEMYKWMARIGASAIPTT